MTAVMNAIQLELLGIAYIVPIATSIRWFPDHKGLVTGVAVAGFGGGRICHCQRRRPDHLGLVPRPAPGQHRPECQSDPAGRGAAALPVDSGVARRTAALCRILS
jgi:hypothetical protein